MSSDVQKPDRKALLELFNAYNEALKDCPRSAAFVAMKIVDFCHKHYLTYIDSLQASLERSVKNSDLMLGEILVTKSMVAKLIEQKDGPTKAVVSG